MKTAFAVKKSCLHCSKNNDGKDDDKKTRTSELYIWSGL